MSHSIRVEMQQKQPNNNRSLRPSDWFSSVASMFLLSFKPSCDVIWTYLTLVGHMSAKFMRSPWHLLKDYFLRANLSSFRLTADSKRGSIYFVLDCEVAMDFLLPCFSCIDC